MTYINYGKEFRPVHTTDDNYKDNDKVITGNLYS